MEVSRRGQGKPLMLVPVVSTGMQAPAVPAESEGMAHR